MISWNLPRVFNSPSSAKTFKELGRETIGPYRLSVRQRTDRLLYFVPRWDIVQSSARGALLKLVHNARVKGRRPGVKQFVKPPHPPLADEGIIPQQSTFLVLDVLRVKRPLPFHIQVPGRDSPFLGGILNIWGFYKRAITKNGYTRLLSYQKRVQSKIK